MTVFVISNNNNMTDLKGKNSEPFETFIESFNDLDLSESLDIDIPTEIIFPSELNKYLKEKLQYLTHENGMLKKNLCETEFKLSESKTKIETLSSKIETYQSNNEFTSVTNIARTKIVELSKKLREKAAELETYKTKYSRLEHELITVRQNEQETEEKKVKVEKPTNELELEIKSFEEKVANLNSKLFEEKNSSLKLKNDLKLANKLLQEEIGEKFESLQQITGSNWRGRSQIITDLQHKINELRDKLKQFQDKDGTKNQEKKTLLEKKIEKITKENEDVKNESADLKRRLENVKARYKSVDLECQVWKSKYMTATEQVEKDTEIITSLTHFVSSFAPKEIQDISKGTVLIDESRVHRGKHKRTTQAKVPIRALGNLPKTEKTTQNTMNFNAQNEILRKKESFIEKLQKDLKTMRKERTKEICKAENLERALADKEREACSLNNNLRPLTVVDDQLPQRFEAERIRLSELMVISNQRLNTERDARSKVDDLYRQERQRAARLEAKLARLKLEESSEKGTYSSLTPKNFNARDNAECKLELALENIKALQTRLDIQKREKDMDYQEFCNIIKNCKCTRD